MLYTEEMFNTEQDAEMAAYAQQLQFMARSLASQFEMLNGVSGAESRATKIAEELSVCEAILYGMGVPCPG